MTALILYCSSNPTTLICAGRPQRARGRSSLPFPLVARSNRVLTDCQGLHSLVVTLVPQSRCRSVCTHHQPHPSQRPPHPAVSSQKQTHKDHWLGTAPAARHVLGDPRSTRWAAHRFAHQVMLSSCVCSSRPSSGDGMPATGQHATPMVLRVMPSTCACASSGAVTHVL